MTYEALLARVGDLPLIDSPTLRSWGGNRQALSVQLSRWVRGGKLLQLRREAYLLPPALRRVHPSPEYLANLLVMPSYVSLERALSLHGLVPERVPLVQSVTAARPARFCTSEGDFEYRHVKPSWFFGYAQTPVATGAALVAWPEKALLDLVHLAPGTFDAERVAALRLQELHRIDLEKLVRIARGHGDRLEREAAMLAKWIRRERRR